MPRKMVSWSSARTDPVAGVVVVHAVLGRHDESAELRARPGPAVVELLLSVDGPDGPGRASGHPRTLLVDIGDPLAGRLLRDPAADRTRTPYDGTRLVVPAVLPGGLRPVGEAGHSAPGQPQDPPSHWCQGLVTVPLGGMRASLWQGRGAPFDLHLGDEWTVDGDVRTGGDSRQLWRSRITRGAILTWPHPAGVDLTLHVTAAGHGDPMPALRRFLDGLDGHPA